jgi:hypothetical protein
MSQLGESGSSSRHVLFTNTNNRCATGRYYWSCGHETSKTIRHNLCWICNDLEVGLCEPEPVDVDKNRACSGCRAHRAEEIRRLIDQGRAEVVYRERQDWDREKEREGRRRDQQRAEARDRERQQDREREMERIPRAASTWVRRRYD